MKRKKKTTVAETTPAEWEKTSLQRFQPLLSADEFELLTNELQHPLQPSFRINPLKMKPEGVLQLAKRYHWMLAPIPFCPTGYRLKEASASVSLSQTLEHRMGQYYIQEAASMIPVELFHLDADLPGLFLDLAASPGGKTTHLVSRGGDRSLVIANDSSAGRIPALQIVLQNWGAVNQMITQFPGEKYGMWFPEAFDRVLIDAPCSMQGLRTTESHETRPVTDREILALSKRQVSLLTSALQAVKVGERLSIPLARWYLRRTKRSSIKSLTVSVIRWKSCKPAFLPLDCFLTAILITTLKWSGRCACGRTGCTLQAFSPAC